MTPEGWMPGADVVLPAGQTYDEVMAAGPDWFMNMQPDDEA